jgi:hypothetical protein
MLAKNLRAACGVRCPALSLTTIASLLAPTSRAPVCRSEHAREKPESAVWCQVRSAIVDDHREPARSYKSSASL